VREWWGCGKAEVSDIGKGSMKQLGKKMQRSMSKT